MKEVIIGYFVNATDKNLYLWENNEYVYDWKIENEMLCAIVETENGLQLIRVVGTGEVKKETPMKKALKVFEMSI